MSSYVRSLKQTFLADAVRALQRQLAQYVEETEGDQRHELRDRAAELSAWWRKTEGSL